MRELCRIRSPGVADPPAMPRRSARDVAADPPAMLPPIRPRCCRRSARRRTYDPPMPPLSIADPLAHRALEALMRAESHVRRGIAAELQRAGLSTGAFSVLVVLTTAGGELELRTLRRRLGWSKANATEVTAALENQGLVVRRRLVNDRRAMAVALSADGAELVQRVFPTHADKVSAAFASLDEDEKRSLASICRKLAA
jgi:MarR family 2-MHQ and catechol resistance regulon transcriptional repressor